MGLKRLPNGNMLRVHTIFDNTKVTGNSRPAMTRKGGEVSCGVGAYIDYAAFIFSPLPNVLRTILQFQLLEICKKRRTTAATINNNGTYLSGGGGIAVSVARR